MSRRRTRRQPRPEAERWARAERHLRCPFGCAITPGQWIRWGKLGAVCGRCMETRYKMTPPQRAFTFQSEAPQDVRDRQAGED